MRILFFSIAKPICLQKNNKYNGGGWIESVIDELSKKKDFSLGYAYVDNNIKKTEHQQVTYYSLSPAKRCLIRDISVLFGGNYQEIEKTYWKSYIDQMQNVINDFHPDIIHIWGSEREFGLIAKECDIPVILHIQGIMNPYLNAFMPSGVSWEDLYRNINPIKGIHARLKHYAWLRHCYREREIIKSIKYYLGRTEWDKRVTHILNPTAEYYYCSEILRSVFYEEGVRNIPATLEIVTTISSPLYKGFDLVLKTAQIMKEVMNLDFNWKVFGNINPSYTEHKVGISCKDVNVSLMGVADANQLKNEILNCTVYFHPSYIDNSPNSICEAQILGSTVIACNVGGVSSLIKDDETGYLIPANDPYQAAFLIKTLFNDECQNKNIGKKAHKIASQRHNKNSIIKDLTDIYRKII